MRRGEMEGGRGRERDRGGESGREKDVKQIWREGAGERGRGR